MNTPKTLEPVSKMTVKCWRGVPTEMLTKYCVMSVVCVCVCVVCAWFVFRV